MPCAGNKCPLNAISRLRAPRHFVEIAHHDLDLALRRAPARGSDASTPSIGSMPHKGLLTAQLGTGGMRLNAGAFQRVGGDCYRAPAPALEG
jgi:hypothetical protein